MRLYLLTAALVAGISTSTPAYALVMAFVPPAQRAISADVIVVGKVASVAEELVQAEPYPGAKQKVGYQIATIKIGTGVQGSDKMTEIKVGFIPPPKPNPKAPVGGIRPPIRSGGGSPQLKEGQEWMLFLSKHPSADFYIMPNMSPPVEMKDDQGKKDLEAVKKVVALLADPQKGLKSENAETRAETAAVLVLKYRSYPQAGGQADQVSIGAEQSKQILEALLEGDWSNRGFRPDALPNGLAAFQNLGLNQKDGWVQPIVVNQPGAPPVDYGAVQKDAFMKWLAGPGKKYEIKKFVSKPAANEK